MNPTTTPWRSETILIVDDELMIRRTLRRLLEAAGLPRENIAEASSGEDALRLLQQRAFTAVVCDYRMREVDGVEVLAWVAQHHPLCARVLLTGFADLQVAIGAINQGKVGVFVQKPWDNEELLDLLRSAVETQSVLGTLAAGPGGA